MYILKGEKMEEFKIAEIFFVKPSIIYDAWLNSKVHGEMIGSDADIDSEIGGKFNIWDGYISGRTIELTKYKKIVQEWRTTEFPENCADSILELDFEETKNGTKLILKHSNIPDSQSEEYKQGWLDFYFKPMKDYFSKK
jgi:activator of HSP90 ATPase